MRTTLTIDDTVLQRLREEAARRNTTMSALAEAGLRRILDDAPSPATPPGDLPPLPTWNGGKPRVDVADREALEALMAGCGPHGTAGA